MSRIAKNPIIIPKEVVTKLEGRLLTVTGKKGTLTSVLHPKVNISIENDTIRMVYDRTNQIINALSG